jgi:hypothetical protein
MRRLLKTDALRYRNEAIDPDVRHRFVRGLDRVGVQFHPAGLGQFHEAARGRGET